MAKPEKNAVLSESGQWLRTRQTGGAFECTQCGNAFQTLEQLRQHEVDCLSDDMDIWES